MTQAREAHCGDCAYISQTPNKDSHNSPPLIILDIVKDILLWNALDPEGKKGFQSLMPYRAEEQTAKYDGRFSNDFPIEHRDCVVKIASKLIRA